MKNTMTAAEYRALMGQPAKAPTHAAVTPGRVRMPSGEMNKTEARYAQHLDFLKHGGSVLWYGFEAVTLRLAKRTRYTPDFAVLTEHGLEFHEIKGGYWEDDARVKIKVAAEMFPFWRFLGITALRKKDGGGWRREEF